MRPRKQAGPRAVHRFTFELFIPLTDDATGVMHTQEAFDDWQLATARRFGGLTWLGIVQGAWFDDERAEIVRDRSHGYLVGVEEGQERELVAHAGEAAATFGQKCIFLERRGTAILVYPRSDETQRFAAGSALYPLDDGGVLRGVVADAGGAAYATRSVSATSDPDVEHLTRIDEQIAHGVDYLEVLQYALGPGSPLLRGKSFPDAAVQSTASYLRARDRVTEYGRALGLVARVPSTSEILMVRDGHASYGTPLPRCVSQYRAAALLGWTFDRVRAAMASGELAAVVVDGACVVEQSSLERLRGR